MDAVRRSGDNELCGFVDQRHDGWHALTVFGATLEVHATALDAQATVLSDGLGSLMERWVLVDGIAADERIVCIQEAHPDAVTVALDHYSLPGVPTMQIARADLDTGRWSLRPNR